jgi:hypothetical protein
MLTVGKQSRLYSYFNVKKNRRACLITKRWHIRILYVRPTWQFTNMTNWQFANKTFWQHDNAPTWQFTNLQFANMTICQHDNSPTWCTYFHPHAIWHSLCFLDDHSVSDPGSGAFHPGFGMLQGPDLGSSRIWDPLGSGMNFVRIPDLFNND